MSLRLLILSGLLLASHACAQPKAPVPPPAPAGPLQIGMNLQPITPNNGEQPFVDRAKTMQWSADWQPLGPGDTAPDGFPERIPPGRGALTSSTTLDPGSKRYVLLYAGSPAVSVYQPHEGRNTITWGPGVSDVDYSRPGRIAFTANGIANWSIGGFDAARPLHDLHIVRADQEQAWRGGAIINPDWLARFGRHFSPMRMMDWGCTNGSGLQHWRDRPVTTQATWPCVPLEVMIELANRSDADLWLNVPAHADDDYVRQLATLVRDRLKPGRRLHLEYSNEVWNTQFEQTKWAQTQGDRLWGGGAPLQLGNEIWYGYRAAQIMAIAKGVLGNRLLGVLGTWPGWGTSEVDDAIARGVAKAGKGTIPALFREYAVTTYFGNDFSYSIGNEADRPITLGWAQGGAAGLDQAFKQIEQGGLLKADASLAALRRGYVRHAQQARAWGLSMVAYEGGFHIFLYMAPENERAARLDLLNRMLADPRMGAAYRRMAQDFRAAGGTVLAHFNDVAPPSIWGAWGVIPDLTATSPRYEALRAMGRP